MINMLKMMGLVLLFSLNQSAFAEDMDLTPEERMLMEEYGNGFEDAEYEDEDLDEEEAIQVEDTEEEVDDTVNEELEKQRLINQERYNEMRRRNALRERMDAMRHTEGDGHDHQGHSHGENK